MEKSFATSVGSKESVSQHHEGFSSLIDKVATYENAHMTTERQDLLKRNIETIREVVAQGRHDTLYYPASGFDIIRVLVAYDATQIFAADPFPDIFEKTKAELEQLGIKVAALVSEDGKTQELQFELEGKARRIHISRKDARLSAPKQPADILHLYLPNGIATNFCEDDLYYQQKYGEGWSQELKTPEAYVSMTMDPKGPKPDPETDQYPVVAEGIQDALTIANYRRVKEKGFFVFSERKLLGNDALYKLAGLKEATIQQRQPSRTLTSGSPTQQEVETKDERGYLYQKAETVPDKVIEIFNQAQAEQSRIKEALGLFQSGYFQSIGIGEKEGEPHGESLKEFYRSCEEMRVALADAFLRVGSDPLLVEEYVMKTKQDLREQVVFLQKELKELMDEYQRVFAEQKQGLLTTEQILSRLGIIVERDENGRILNKENTKWSLAHQLTMGGGRHTVYKVVQAFIDTDVL